VNGGSGRVRLGVFAAVAILFLGSVLLIAEKTAAAAVTVPWVANPVADADLDGDPATGDWGGAASTAVPLENGEAGGYGTATLYAKHDGTTGFFRIDGQIDVPWTSAGGNHFWLGIMFSELGTVHHASGTWDGVFFGLWNGGDYAPAATYPPAPVDTYGFDRPPLRDGSQDLVGRLRYSGSSAPYAFTAEWKRALDTGDGNDIPFVADGGTALNFFVTTDSDGDGSEGGVISHNVITNSNRMLFEQTGGGVSIPPGALVCGSEGDPVADGQIDPQEYHSTYFDPATRIAVYMTCTPGPAPRMHLALAAPWAGWVAILVQASDAEPSAYNEVRIMHAGGGAVGLDAYANGSLPFLRDTAAGGTEDVGAVVHGHGGSVQAFVVHGFELSFPLQSADALDCRLSGAGPYSLLVQYNATAEGFDTPPQARSAPVIFYVDTRTVPGKEPTSLELVQNPSGDPAGSGDFLAILRNASGYPIANAPLQVSMKTAFGFRDLGPVGTNEDGVAAFNYTPRGDGEFLLGVAYLGGAVHRASVLWQLVEIKGATEPGAPRSTLHPVEAIVAMALMGVWSTYAYAYFVVHQTFASGSGGRRFWLRLRSSGQAPKEGEKG